MSRIPEIKREKKELDAAGQSVGRLASQIAILLQGKHKPDYEPHYDKGDTVEVKNAGQMKITGNKFDTKKYYRYSGYPGGLKEKTLKVVFDKDPGEVLRRAVKNMLPKNRLQKERMKRLMVHND